LATQVYEEKELPVKFAESPALTNFIESLSNSKDTRGVYLANLRKFMRFSNVDSPEELLSWDPKVIENRIITYVVSCRNRGRAQRSINVYFAVIKHFFKMNDINTGINWDKIKRFVGKANGKRAIDRPYSYEEIHKLLEYSTPRERVLILLQCSAGLRAGGIPYLKVGHLRKIPEHGIYEITVYAGTDDEYITYCSVECAAAIDSYLEFRKVRLNETITEDSPLVINLADKEHGNNGKNTSQAITVENVQQVIYRLLKDVGLRNTQNKKQMFSGECHITATCHSLRKFFRSQLHFAKVDHLHAETLVGHSTGLVGVYTKISLTMQ
jgi:site-specific recombinase XerD